MHKHPPPSHTHTHPGHHPLKKKKNNIAWNPTSYRVVHVISHHNSRDMDRVLDAYGLFVPNRFMIAHLLIDWLYICMLEFCGWLCIFLSGRQKKAYGFYPFQEVVRHIFIHVNIIFYIWIFGLFNELQYNAMYFYIVSSFLFKDRDYFISCNGEIPCIRGTSMAKHNTFIRAIQLLYIIWFLLKFFFLFMLCFFDIWIVHITIVFFMLAQNSRFDFNEGKKYSICYCLSTSFPSPRESHSIVCWKSVIRILLLTNLLVPICVLWWYRSMYEGPVRCKY